MLGAVFAAIVSPIAVGAKNRPIRTVRTRVEEATNVKAAMPTAPILLWFRQDLRLSDNRALAAAIDTGRPILPVYILDDETPGPWRLGGASRWWLHHSLDALGRDLAALGCPLVLRRGAALPELRRLAGETGAAAVYCTRAYEPWARETEDALAGSEIAFKRFAGCLLFEPDALTTKSGTPFRVFTPFWKACQAAPAPKPPLPKPRAITASDSVPRSDRLADWALLPTGPDWSGGLRETWNPGEANARTRLSDFLDDAMRSYADRRDRPDIAGTSRLSPHLHFGEISPHRCWHAAQARIDAAPDAAKGGRSFLRELSWREFSYHLLFHWPSLPEVPFQEKFAAFAWEKNADGLRDWQRGRTGIPIVDAGMRELWRTGWMHNRVRMIVASLLVKNMLVPWREGEAWFWDTLVDADLANNAASWQWVAGCGADAAPYFRIFNPVLQGRKFDPDGAYVRRYVPELNALPDKHIHAPWEAPAEVLAAVGVRLGETYPRPILDLRESRAKALAAYDTVKARGG